MRTILLWAVCLLFCANAQALQFQRTGDVALTGDATIASLYSVRGNNASNGPVVQASVKATHDASGCYAKVWGSQLDFGKGDPANAEVDIILGCAGGNEDGWVYDLSVAYYAFPGAPASLQYNFTEVIMALGYEFKYFTLGGEAAVTYDYFGKGKEALYTRAIVTIPLTDKWSTFGHLGKQSVNYAINTKSYDEWAIGFAYQPNTRLKWEVFYKDTDKRYCTGCGSEVIGKVRVMF